MSFSFAVSIRVLSLCQLDTCSLFLSFSSNAFLNSPKSLYILPRQCKILTQFGSGWAWLVYHEEKLKIIKTAKYFCKGSKTDTINTKKNK